MTGDAVHRERQWVGWWVHLVMAALLVGGVLTELGVDDEPQSSLLLVVLVVIIGLLYLVLMPMEVEVVNEKMEVRFGQFGRPRWRFDLDRIRGARQVEFSPLKDYGGWGIRTRRGKVCLNQRGDRGVEFDYNERTYVVGSDDPERLLEALSEAGAGSAQ